MTRHPPARETRISVRHSQPDVDCAKRARPERAAALPCDEHFRREPAHGDVVHWPVLAVGRYLLASGDGSLLDEEVAWYTPADAEPVPPSTLRVHLEAALAAARAHVLPGTNLVAYGHGDWNDSLQPADPTLTATMTSAWTATLHHTALRTLADGLACADADEVALVADLRSQAAAIAAPGCCCASSCTRCSGSAVGRSASRSTPCCRRGSTG